MKILARLFLLACVLFSSLFAGPFGLEKGQTAKSFGEKIKQTEKSVVSFSLSEPPKPHPFFTDYRIQISSKSGLAEVKAFSDAIASNSFGNQLRSAYEVLESALTKKYGNPKKVDFLQSGSIWNEPNEWMMALAKDERYLGCYWKATPDNQLPDGLSYIELSAYATSREKGLINVMYRFTNFGDIKEEEEKNAASSL